MIILEMKNHNMILTENQQKCKVYHLEKLINMNIWQVKKYCLLIKEGGKFTYFPSRKPFEKQTKTIEEQGKKLLQSWT